MMSQTMVAWPGSCHSGSRCVVKLFISDTQNIVTSHLLLLDQILLAYSTSARQVGRTGGQTWLLLNQASPVTKLLGMFEQL